MKLLAVNGFSAQLLLGITLLATPVMAVQTEPVTLEKATIFLQGAELFGSAKITLPAGRSDVVLTQIASEFNEQSLVVAADNGVTVQSTAIRRDYLTEQYTQEVQDLRKALEEATQAQEVLYARRDVIKAQLAVLRNNRSLGANNGDMVAQVNQMLELVSSKMSQLLLADIALQPQIDAAEKQIKNLTQQLDAISQRQQVTNVVLVTLDTPRPVTSNISLSYVIEEAGWTPGYDVRVPGLNKPVYLDYKADIYQRSGIDWKQVKLSLSTGNPTEGAEVPFLSPWYLDLASPVVARPAATQDMQLEEMASAAEVKIGVATDEQPRVIVETGGINTRFMISQPHTITTNSQPQSVLIKQHELTGNYRHIAIPKLAPDAFIQVQLTGWENLGLLAGRSQIFFEGAFVGQGIIDPTALHNGQGEKAAPAQAGGNKSEVHTLDVSLGRDKQILITRSDENMTTDKADIFGNNSSQRFAHHLEIKNTRQDTINLTLLEQIPLSRNNSITIEEVVHDQATYNKQTGEVSWTIPLKPAETRKLDLSYLVKYPQNKTVTGL